MKRTIAALAGLVLTVSAAFAQEVKFEKYQLDNGMTVILHEDHSLPIVSVNTWYYVGAKEEAPHRSGFAHLFEHLMFMGTQRVPTGQFDQIMEGGGGSNNASTSFDRTNYYSNGPAGLLPTLLWLDADRLEDLGHAMTQEKLDRQRDVVRNERRQTTENAPYGKSELLVTALMFPEGHPYHNEVIGTHEDLESATLLDVKDFFANYYVPNNASLVVAGDFDPAKTKPLIASLFGTIAKGEEVRHKTVPPVKLQSVLRATTLDQVQFPKIEMAYHSPASFAEGDAEMDLVGAVLSQGKSSRLYKRLVMDEKVAVDVAAYQNSNKLQSVFRIDITTKPDADLDKIEREVDEEVARICDEGMTKDELDQRIATVELGKLAQLQRLGSVADKLNEYEYFYGTPDGFKRDLDRYRNATPDTVRTWAKRVLTQDARAIVRVLPEQPQHEASARDTRPKDFAPKSFSPSEPTTFKLSNGIPVMLWTKPELPLVAVQLLFKQDGPLDAPAESGEAELTAQMLGEGAGSLSATQFADAVQSLGATFGSGADQESATVSMTGLKRNFGKAAGLLADAIERPRLEQADWDRVKRLQLEDLKQQEDEPHVVAGRVASRALFGKDNPYGWPVAGTQQTVQNLTLENIKARYQSFYRPDNATILIAGDLTADQAKSLLDKALGSWQASGSAQPKPAAGNLAAAPGQALRVILVDRPGAVQTVIRFMTPGYPATDPKRVQLRVLNELLGGTFTSRLNQNLREAHGYTYGASSRFSMDPSTGSWSAGASVVADKTGVSLTEFFNEFKRIRAGDIAPEEVTKATESLRTGLVEQFESMNGVLGAAGNLVESGLPFSTLGADVQSMQGITAPELNKLAPKALPVETGVLVLVGDKGLITSQIKDLDLPAPVEYTAEGEPK